MTQKQNTYEPVIAPQLKKAANTLGDVAKLWISQGLNAGKQVLETSAKSLTLTAELVDGFKRRVDGDAKH